MKEFEDILLERFDEGRPILVGDILSLFPDVSRVTVYQRINSAISKGSLERYGRGVYCIPRQGLFGKVPLSAESVIERKFIACGDEVFGYYSGLALENRAGLSEQVPAVLEITTNASSKGVRSLGPAGGWKDVVIRKPRCEVTAENVDVLRFLDAVSAISPQKWARRHFAAWAALRVRRAETVPSPMLTIIRQRPRRG